MPTVIVLTAEQADVVRGPSTARPDFARLQPIALTDGRFYVGVEVLAGPDFAEHHAFLAALPQVDFATLADLIPPPAH
jgi:hypothetical protein